MLKTTQENLFKVLELSLFITLCIISLFFMKEVLTQFNSGWTSFKMYELNNPVRPTITMCLNDEFLRNYSWFEHTYGIDIDIYYDIDDEWVYLSLENNAVNINKEEIIYLRQLKPMWKYGTCYKISSETFSNSAITRGNSQSILVKYNESIPIDNLPLLTIYFTSEKNAYGLIFAEWMDGEVLEFNIKNNMYEEFILRTEKYLYLKADSNCSDDSFYECFESKLITNNFDGCPRKCLPDITLPSYKKYDEIYSTCQIEEEFNCSNKIAKEMFYHIIETEICQKSCSILQYLGKVQYKEEASDTHSVEFKYRFAYLRSVKVYEEYFIYDEIGLIGSVGGTLGMFIGFSFTGVISCFINFLKRSTFTIKIKSKSTKIGQSNEFPKTMVVKPIFLESQTKHQIVKNLKQLSMDGKYDCPGNLDQY